MRGTSGSPCGLGTGDGVLNRVSAPDDDHPGGRTAADGGVCLRLGLTAQVADRLLRAFDRAGQQEEEAVRSHPEFIGADRGRHATEIVVCSLAVHVIEPAEFKPGSGYMRGSPRPPSQRDRRPGRPEPACGIPRLLRGSGIGRRPGTESPGPPSYSLAFVRVASLKPPLMTTLSAIT